MTNPITSFHGEHSFLSNFTYVSVELDGVRYPSVEHAYQAAKTNIPAERYPFSSAAMDDDKRNGRDIMTSGRAKRAGRKVTLDPQFDATKADVMRGLLQQKFAHPKFGALLDATGDAELIEGNTWGDRYWGVCNGTGQNVLGRLLMAIRDERRA